MLEIDYEMSSEEEFADANGEDLMSMDSGEQEEEEDEEGTNEEHGWLEKDIPDYGEGNATRLEELMKMGGELLVDMLGLRQGHQLRMEMV